MEKAFKYLDNQFANATRDNYKRALKLSNYHDAALAGASVHEPLLLPIYTRYSIVHLEYVNRYNVWKSAGGAQTGETLNVKQLLQIAMDKLNDWDVRIQAVYAKTTPRYKAIFSQGRKPFNKGGLDSRINAFETLSKNIGTDVALAAVKGEIDSTYSGLDGARDTQEVAKGSTKYDSSEVNLARLAAMNMQYRDLGFCMDNFFDKLEGIVNGLFDLEILRQHQQTIFTGTLDPSENEAVLIHTFLADDELRLKNKGDAPIAFYLSNVHNGTNSTAVTVAPQLETTIQAAAFGIADYGTYRYLTAVNQSIADATSYLIELY